MKKRLFSALTIFPLIILFTLSVLAHSGRTDGSGGHRDNKNKSGLGSYHYHCGGYPPHLHTNGVCPYKSSTYSNSPSSHSGGYSNSSSSYSGGSSYSNTPRKIYASGITAINVPSTINMGESAELDATVYPSNAEDKTIFWESSDTNILVVGKTGDLTAVGIGTAIITAKTERGTSKKFTISVTEVIAEKIEIVNKVSEILLDDTKTLQCAFAPTNTTYKTVEWSSSDESILSVSPYGKITAKKIGSATITALHKELTDSINIEVKPIDAKKIEIILTQETETNDNNQPKLRKGLHMQFTAAIEPKNTTYKDIEWCVNDETVATVDKNGILTAKSPGIVTVTATAKSGVTEEIKIEVYSNDGYTVAGISALATIGGGAIYYYKKKKKW